MFGGSSSSSSSSCSIRFVCFLYAHMQTHSPFKNKKWTKQRNKILTGNSNMAFFSKKITLVLSQLFLKISVSFSLMQRLICNEQSSNNSMETNTDALCSIPYKRPTIWKKYREDYIYKAKIATNLRSHPTVSSSFCSHHLSYRLFSCKSKISKLHSLLICCKQQIVCKVDMFHYFSSQ